LSFIISDVSSENGITYLIDFSFSYSGGSVVENGLGRSSSGSIFEGKLGYFSEFFSDSEELEDNYSSYADLFFENTRLGFDFIAF